MDMETSFYSAEELKNIGFKKIGNNVLLSRKCSIYGANEIKIGNNVRIDDFCILSGKIDIGNYIHIAAYSSIYAGNAGVFICDFANISSRCAIYAKSDDYSGQYLTNPMVEDDYLGVIEHSVSIKKHVIVGTGCTILPGTVLGEGVAVGAMSLVKESLEPFGIYAGIPCKFIKKRSRHLLSLENKFLDSIERRV